MIKNIKIKTLVGLGAGILFLSLSIFSQSPRRPDVGFQAGNSYALSDIETINTRNGNMMLAVPLASLPAGRGSSGGFTLNLYYNSKIWNGRQEIFDNTTPPSGNPSYCDQFPSQGYRYTIENLEQSGEGGWYLGGYYDLVVTNRIDIEGQRPESDTETFSKNYYKWKVQVRYRTEVYMILCRQSVRGHILMTGILISTSMVRSEMEVLKLVRIAAVGASAIPQVS